MAARPVERVMGSIREGVAGAGERVEDVVDRIEDALDDAMAEGRHMKRRVKSELVKRWRTVDRVGRENAFTMALGALALGVLVGYLVARNRD